MTGMQGEEIDMLIDVFERHDLDLGHYCYVFGLLHCSFTSLGVCILLCWTFMA